MSNENKSSPIQKTYLGDGVYAWFDGFNYVLQTSDGIRVTNEIVMEPEVVHAFMVFKQGIEND